MRHVITRNGVECNDNVMVCMITYDYVRVCTCFSRSPYAFFFFLRDLVQGAPNGSWAAAKVFPHVWFLLRQGQHHWILSSSIPLREGKNKPVKFLDGAKRSKSD